MPFKLLLIFRSIGVIYLNRHNSIKFKVFNIPLFINIYLLKLKYFNLLVWLINILFKLG